MNVPADSHDWPPFPQSSAVRERLVGVVDGRLRIVLADARLGRMLGSPSLEQRDLLDFVADDRSRRLLLLALQGVTPEVEVRSPAGGVLVARGTVTRTERSLLLYERSAAEAPVARSSQVRARHFVGRETELDSFDSFLVSDEPSILFVQGPHGIGKTALLAAFAARCVELACVHVKVDAQASPMDERSIVDALSAPTGPNATDLARLLAGARIVARKWVLFIDNFDAWIPEASAAFRGIFDRLPPDTRIVLAGRRHPERQWWSGCSRDTNVISLGALDRESSKGLLRLLSTRPEARDEILSRANGHPICLVTLAHASRMPGDPSVAADNLVDTSLDASLPPRILDVAALPARITEDLLADLLGEEATAHDVYDVLTTICVRDACGVGLRMPWALRTTIVRKLKGRSPERFAALRARLVACYARRLDECTSAKLPQLVDDVLDSFTDVSLVNVLTGRSPEPQVRRAGDSEVADITAAAQRLGGESTAAIVGRRMSEGLALGLTYVAVRDGTIEGIVQCTVTSIEQVSRGAHEREDSPLAAAVDALHQLGGLEAQDCVAICTTWLTHELAVDEWGPTSNALSRMLLRSVLSATPRVVATAFVMPPGEPRLPLLQVPGARRVRTGGYSVVLRDHRGVSRGSALSALLETTETSGRRATLVELGASRTPEPSPIRVETVRSALMQLASPEDLASSPLVSTRLVQAATSPNASVADRALTLGRLLRNTILSLAGSPRDAKARSVLAAVFLGEGGKHEQIARDLGLPYSTFRRYLAHGIERVTETLRERERES